MQAFEDFLSRQDPLRRRTVTLSVMSNSPLVSVTVPCRLLANTMVSAPALVLAAVMAARRELGPLSFRFRTLKVLGKALANGYPIFCLELSREEIQERGNTLDRLVFMILGIGQERIHPEQVPEIFAARDRRLAGPSVPAHGLHLISVEY